MRVGELERILRRGRPGVAERRAGRRDRRRRDRERRVEPTAAEGRRAPRHRAGGRDRHRRRAAGPQRRADREERDRVRPPQARRRLARDARRDRAGRAQGAPAPPGAPHAAVRRATSRSRASSLDAVPARPRSSRPRADRASGSRAGPRRSRSRRRSLARVAATGRRRGRRAVPARAAVGGDARGRRGRGPALAGSTRRSSGTAWGALAGVGLAWVGLGSPNGELGELRDRVRAAGGSRRSSVVPAVSGDPPVAAPQVQRRLKEAFDPNGVLAPGRGWGGAVEANALRSRPRPPRASRPLAEREPHQVRAELRAGEERRARHHGDADVLRQSVATSTSSPIPRCEKSAIT